MASRWLAVDRLMQELAMVRSESLAVDPKQVGRAVIEKMEAIIARAAYAVDATLYRPDEDWLFYRACQAIVEARGRVEALRQAAGRARLLTAESLVRRQRSARLLYRAVLAETTADRTVAARPQRPA